MSRIISVLGLPSSAGASWPGLEKGPAAYRAAGIIEPLERLGSKIDDRRDLPIERWRSALTVEGRRQVNNIEATVMVAERVKAATAEILAAGRFPLILGGDCFITVGAYAGALDAGLDPALIYVDGGWDISTPATTHEAHLDGMGVATS